MLRDPMRPIVKLPFGGILGGGYGRGSGISGSTEAVGLKAGNWTTFGARLVREESPSTAHNCAYFGGV
jgi:hypothetical protein